MAKTMVDISVSVPSVIGLQWQKSSSTLSLNVLGFIIGDIVIFVAVGSRSLFCTLQS